MPLRPALVALCLGSAVPAAAETPCGGATACRVEGGAYRIELPADGDTRGAYVFFHGYKGSAELQMRQQRGLVDTALAHHLAFVAVDSVDGSWSFPNAPRAGRDELRFLGRVLDDLKARHGLGTGTTVLGGFSLGASMAYYAACSMGSRIGAMVTFSGVFWDPLPAPADCVAEQPRMIHFHGTRDRTFPLAGRPIGAVARQGDTFASVAVLRESAGCAVAEARRTVIAGVECDDVPGCLRGDSILCIHDGGHEARAAFLDAGLRELGYPE